MLADAVEAASRTLDDPKPSRMKSLIKKITDSKLQAGELADFLFRAVVTCILFYKLQTKDARISFNSYCFTDA